MNTCPDCNGVGFVPRWPILILRGGYEVDEMVCPGCAGNGQFENRRKVTEKCPDCDGLGFYEEEAGYTDSCKGCDGLGFIQYWVFDEESPRE